MHNAQYNEYTVARNVQIAVPQIANDRIIFDPILIEFLLFLFIRIFFSHDLQANFVDLLMNRDDNRLFVCVPVHDFTISN